MTLPIEIDAVETEESKARHLVCKLFLSLAMPTFLSVLFNLALVWAAREKYPINQTISPLQHFMQLSQAQENHLAMLRTGLTYEGFFAFVSCAGLLIGATKSIDYFKQRRKKKVLNDEQVQRFICGSFGSDITEKVTDEKSFRYAAGHMLRHIEVVNETDNWAARFPSEIFIAVLYLLALSPLLLLWAVSNYVYGTKHHLAYLLSFLLLVAFNIIVSEWILQQDENKNNEDLSAEEKLELIHKVTATMTFLRTKPPATEDLSFWRPFFESFVRPIPFWLEISRYSKYPRVTLVARDTTLLLSILLVHFSLPLSLSEKVGIAIVGTILTFILRTLNWWIYPSISHLSITNIPPLGYLRSIRAFLITPSTPVIGLVLFFLLLSEGVFVDKLKIAGLLLVIMYTSSLPCYSRTFSEIYWDAAYNELTRARSALSHHLKARDRATPKNTGRRTILRSLLRLKRCLLQGSTTKVRITFADPSPIENSRFNNTEK